jgi:hypothetical protein
MPKRKSPLRVYSARDRRTAARVLRAARHLLAEGTQPFPALEAARRAGVHVNNPAWELVAQARGAANGQPNDLQLETAATLIETNNEAIRKACSPKLTRVPRCRLRVTGGRCGRPVAHGGSCTLDPSSGDLVRSVGTDHVLVGGLPTDTTMIVAWETGTTGKHIRVRRDDHDRGLWIDIPAGQPRKAGTLLLLGWAEVRRLVLDLNLELADHRGPTAERKKPPP